jgi:predicted permease
MTEGCHRETPSEQAQCFFQKDSKALLDFPQFAGIRLDAGVLLFSLGATIVTALLAGTTPALALTRFDIVGRLVSAGRSPAEGSGRRLAEAIVVVQIAIAVMLTVGASLLALSFLNLSRVDPGFRTGGTLTAQMTLPRGRYRRAADIRRFERELVARASALPGVRAAGVMNSLPLAGRAEPFNFRIAGRPADTHAAQSSAEMRVASPGYFHAMGIPLLEGRHLEDADTADRPPVLVVNRAMARRFWGDASPLGARLSIAGPEGPWVTIVGVVGDVRHTGLAAGPRPEMYLPFEQETWPKLTLVVRSAADSTTLAQDVRRMVAGIDPELPVHDVRPMQALVARALRQPRLQAALVTTFAALALLLAMAGVFGVTAHAVSRRLPEIAIRIALGGDNRTVLVLVVRQGLRLTAFGVSAGIACAWLLTSVMAAHVFDIAPNDPVVFIGTALGVTAAAIAATYFPARRATRVDPARLLRSD